MKALVIGAVGVAALGGLALLAGTAKASSDDETGERELWLIQGHQYSITHHIVGPGWSADLYPGFTNFSQPVMVQSGPGWGVVQFTATWSAPNQLYQVPESMSIEDVSA